MTEQTSGFLLIFTEPAQGKDTEFNEWYEVHSQEIVAAVDGIKAVRRFRVNSKTEWRGTGEHSYLAIYEITEPADVIQARLVAATPGLTRSDTLDSEASPPILAFYDAISGVLSPPTPAS
ncbi:hypothetical protein [Microbacterium sp.]|uniref:hypothetical protein n=1 Tax=Microbacterium sp. TaxID=51671 RepID=UPI002735810F|nr:hypothetical protein [Microbacterium sp.]MDP3950433.1 hypothetical protein [Microbacterium sp.]